MQLSASEKEEVVNQVIKQFFMYEGVTSLLWLVFFGLPGLLMQVGSIFAYLLKDRKNPFWKVAFVGVSMAAGYIAFSPTFGAFGVFYALLQDFIMPGLVKNLVLYNARRLN